ncbi:MAG: polysaccharide deacetylase family protein, partial [Bacteroidetes bacterium]|nr:polysaccharide deacetylase family protein [Bacteroidota bacterium]
MIKNFLFHRVSPERDKLWDPMSIELFEKCIKYITTKYTVVTVENLNTLTDDKKRKHRYATISFDDGYKDNILYALPILNKYNIKASFYVVTDCIDKNIPTWTYILDYQFQNTTNNNICLDFDFLPENLKIKELKTEDERLSYVKRLKPCLKKLSHENRQLILDKVNTAFNDVKLPSLMMDWNDLRE